MSVIYARKMGFCMGVRRAVALIDEEIQGQNTVSLATYGPLIHNPQVVASYEARGVRSITDPSQAQAGDRVVIRAHGVPGSVRRSLEERGAWIVDATCPKVALSIRKARQAEAEGRQVLLVGDAGHGEMLAVAGSLNHPAAAMVIANLEDARQVTLAAKVTIIAQTTFDEEIYRQIAEIICSRVDDCRVESSICPATRSRQEAVRELAEQVDGIVVIGGKNSANTRRLYEIALSTGVPAWHVEGPEDVPPEAGELKIIGISAGASTPDESIHQTADRVLEMQGAK
jgi:4-hydroxy-3-methylbut-2-en-1-yl diphosphate reductase